MIIGYARVSTDGQSLEAQQASLKAAGAERIFAEKISGAITDRKALAKAIAVLGSGDTPRIATVEYQTSDPTPSKSETRNGDNEGFR
jgi:DNA invertase Pin-like site-specific DNA recombinase